MPKSRVRARRMTPRPAVGRAPQPPGTSHPIYTATMLGFFLGGLVWVTVYYLAGPTISWMAPLGAFNFLIASSLAVIGLLMTMRWR